MGKDRRTLGVTEKAAPVTRVPLRTPRSAIARLDNSGLSRWRLTVQGGWNGRFKRRLSTSRKLTNGGGKVPIKWKLASTDSFRLEDRNNPAVSLQLPRPGDKARLRVVTNENQYFEIPSKFRYFPLPWVYVWSHLIARIWINLVRLPILHVVS